MSSFKVEIDKSCLKGQQIFFKYVKFSSYLNNKCYIITDLAQKSYLSIDSIKCIMTFEPTFYSNSLIYDLCRAYMLKQDLLSLPEYSPYPIVIPHETNKSLSQCITADNFSLKWTQTISAYFSSSMIGDLKAFDDFNAINTWSIAKKINALFEHAGYGYFWWPLLLSDIKNFNINDITENNSEFQTKGYIIWEISLYNEFTQDVLNNIHSYVSVKQIKKVQGSKNKH